jgi:hypothetical protein
MFDIIFHNRKKGRNFILFYLVFLKFYFGRVGDGGAGRRSSSTSKQAKPTSTRSTKRARELKSEEVISSPTCYAAGFCQSFLSCQGIQFLYKRVC